MIVTQAVFMEERVAGLDNDKHVVAIVLREDVQAVDAQVGRILEPVDQFDAQSVTRPDAQGRARKAAVVAECGRSPTPATT